MSLKSYHKKRDFKQTPEPTGEKAERSQAGLRFVVQKHAASRLHYDFRLELDGTMKSWAVPKGPSLNPRDKRLAVMVEDHPLDYRTFEGTIPHGNYGAGTVMVWDEGFYQATEMQSPTDGEQALRKGLTEGHLKFVLDGLKLKGEFSLVRLPKKGKAENNWLLIKKHDDWASEEDITAQDRSVVTQRNLEQISRSESPAEASPPRKTRTVRNHLSRASAEKPAHQVKPMLATLVEEPFDRAGWFYEIKWDGYRAIAEVANGTVSLYSRNHNSFNNTFPTIVESLKTLKQRAVLDGEIVVVDEAGRSRFQLLQKYQKTGSGQLCYYVFDLLNLNGSDLRHEPYRVRRDALEKLLRGMPNVFLSESVPDQGIAFFEAAKEKGLEGILAKNGDSRYQEGRRGNDWLKIKTHTRQEAVIGGFTEPRGSRKNLGALVLGLYEGTDFIYIGHCGGGTTAVDLSELRNKLNPLIQTTCPFRLKPRVNARVHWVAPTMVCEVSFQEWTSEGRMRQPIFLGLRSDKTASSVHRELPQSQPRLGDSHGKHNGKKAVTKKTRFSLPNNTEPPPQVEPTLTNLEKIYWPAEGYTKGDLIAYYREIAPILLPYLRDRPLSLNRHPDGIEGKSFFQKDVAKLNLPPWVETVSIASESKGSSVKYAECQNQETLLFLTNLGCIEMNPWNSRVGSLEKPDYLILDLDPVDLPFERVVETAQAVRKVLDEAEAPSVCKTSGKRGLHICVPLGAQYSHDEARRFAKILATLVHQRLPDTTSLVRSPSLRKGKVYLDFLQNRKGQTLAAAYSVRPFPGTTVSTPLKWQEVRKGLLPSKFTIKTLRQRLDRVQDLWKLVLGKGIELKKCLARIDRLITGRST